MWYDQLRPEPFVPHSLVSGSLSSTFLLPSNYLFSIWKAPASLSIWWKRRERKNAPSLVVQLKFLFSSSLDLVWLQLGLLGALAQVFLGWF